jgi:hypothetical protein
VSKTSSILRQKELQSQKHDSEIASCISVLHDAVLARLAIDPDHLKRVMVDFTRCDDHSDAVMSVDYMRMEVAEFTENYVI